MNETISFEAFMQTYQDLVFSTAVRLVGREAEAEDIAQEVFLKAYEHFDELASSPTASGWLRTVARNMALNHLTRYRNRWRFFSEMTDADEDKDFAADLPATENEAYRPGDADRWTALSDALDKLPDTQRVPLVLYHYEEMSYEDISTRLGISMAKVKTDIHRGRQALYQKLRRCADACLEVLTRPAEAKRAAVDRPSINPRMSLSLL